MTKSHVSVFYWYLHPTLFYSKRGSLTRSTKSARQMTRKKIMALITSEVKVLLFQTSLSTQTQPRIRFDICAMQNLQEKSRLSLQQVSWSYVLNKIFKAEGILGLAEKNNAATSRGTWQVQPAGLLQATGWQRWRSSFWKSLRAVTELSQSCQTKWCALEIQLVPSWCLSRLLPVERKGILRLWPPVCYWFLRWKCGAQQSS